MIYRSLVGTELQIELLPDGHFAAECQLLCVSKALRADLVAAYSGKNSHIVWVIKSPAALTSVASTIHKSSRITTLRLALLARHAAGS